MSYAAMSEASWLWRYKQNSVENHVFWKICILPKKSRCANSFKRDCIYQSVIWKNSKTDALIKQLSVIYDGLI